MTPAKTAERRPPAPKPPRFSGRQVVIIAVSAVVVACLLVLGGYELYSVIHPSHEVTVSRTFTGRVDYLTQDGATGCVQQEGGPRVCAALYTPGGSKLQVGETVRAALEVAHTSAQNSNLLLIYQVGS